MRRPKFGPESQATKLLDVARNADMDQPAAVAAIVDLYPSLQGQQQQVSAYVYDARRALGKRDTARAERLTFDFIRTQHPSPQVPVEPAPKKRRRLWWWGA